MLLADFAQGAEIFIDANIFTYFALQNPTYQAGCTAFLSRVEASEVQAVASVFSLNEAFYTMLIGKGSEILNSTKIKQIKSRLAKCSGVDRDGGGQEVGDGDAGRVRCRAGQSATNTTDRDSQRPAPTTQPPAAVVRAVAVC